MNSYCVFNVGDRRIGIPMASVREILEKDFIVPTPIPLAPEFVHGLFNLRGQVLPFLDLASFVGTTQAAVPAASDRAVIVERGDFRFATIGQRIDTIEASPETFQPIADAALHPALDAEAKTTRGSFQVIHLDRLEACLKQSLKFDDVAESSRQSPSQTNTPPKADFTNRRKPTTPKSYAQETKSVVQDRADDLRRGAAARGCDHLRNDQRL